MFADIFFYCRFDGYKNSREFSPKKKKKELDWNIKYQIVVLQRGN